jgi:hypothetical protein
LNLFQNLPDFSMNLPRRSVCILCALAALALGAWCLSFPKLTPKPQDSLAAAATAVPSRWDALFDSSQAVAGRLELARSLDSSLGLPALAAWLAAIPMASGNASTEQDFVVFNEIVDVSRKRNLHPAHLGPFLCNVVADSRLHPTVRDYAVQHLVLWIADDANAPAEQDALVRQRALAALCALPADPGAHGTSIPGTALLALSDLASRQPALLASHWPDLDRAISGLLDQPSTPLALKLAAVQTAAMAHRTIHLPAIRRLARETPPDSPLMLSALSALGSLGDASDRPFLESYQTSVSLAGRAATTAFHRLSLTR